MLSVAATMDVLENSKYKGPLKSLYLLTQKESSAFSSSKRLLEELKVNTNTILVIINFHLTPTRCHTLF